MFRCWILCMQSGVAPHSFNFFKMLVDEIEDIDDTEAACLLDFVSNVHLQSYNEVSKPKEQT